MIAAALPPPTVDPERVRRAVVEVLSRREYDPVRPSLAERVLGWAVEQLGRLLENLGGGAGLAAWVVILLVLAAVAVLGAWLLRTLRPDRQLADPLTGGFGRGPEDWAADAARHERAGEWREALRCRYRELIAGLARSGLVEEAPGRTTGEYLALIRAELPEAAAPAEALTRAFDAAWYGSAPVGPDEVQTLRADAERVRNAATVPVP